MKWIAANGRSVNFNPAKYRIDWDRKAPSKGAQAVKDFLKKHFEFDNIGEEVCIPSSGKLRIDFVVWSQGFAIEFQGLGVHDEYNKFFHKSISGFSRSLKRDSKKAELLELNGIKLVEITEKDLPLTKKFFEQFEIYL